METIRCAFRLSGQWEYRNGFVLKIFEDGDILCCDMEGKPVKVEYDKVIFEIEDLAKIKPEEKDGIG